MRTETLQISWHNKEPIFSICFHPDGKFATAGGDKMIRLWKLNINDNNFNAHFIACLKGHSASVNVVEFSKSGELLASGGDDGNISIWKFYDNNTNDNNAEELETIPFGNLESTDNEEDESKYAEEIWKSIRTLGGQKDIYDLSWSPNGEYLASGSVDHTMNIWNLNTNFPKPTTFNDHKKFVQGVSWDPLDEIVVSQSSDRSLRFYKRPVKKESRKKSKPLASDTATPVVIENLALKRKADFQISTAVTHRRIIDKNKSLQLKGANETLTVETEENDNTLNSELQPTEKGQSSHLLFLDDEAVATYFRRLDWSPDGMLLAVPTGIWQELIVETDDNKNPHTNSTPIGNPSVKRSKHQHTLYIFHRGDISAPMSRYLGFTESPLIVKFSPIFYSYNVEKRLLSMPYKMVFAVATSSSVYLFDTQHMHPFSILKNLHPYSTITDLAWSPDGLTLAVSALDGYCSFAVFNLAELGTPLTINDPSYPEAIKQLPAPISIVDKLIGGTNRSKAKNVDTSIIASSPIKEAFEMEIEPDFAFDNTAILNATNLNETFAIEPNFSFDEPAPQVVQPEVTVIPTLTVKRKVAPVIVEAAASHTPEINNNKENPSSLKKARVVKPVLISDTMHE